MSDLPQYSGKSWWRQGNEATERQADRSNAIAMEVHALLRERNCNDLEIVSVAGALLHNALLRMPQHEARPTFSAMITTMLEGLGFEQGRRERR